ncbi:MAG: GPR endopeptidase [Eubacteriales bacterium]
MKNYIYSDLAVESRVMSGGRETENGEYREKKKGDSTVCRLEIKTEETAKKYGRAKGTYITVFCDKIWRMNDAELGRLADIISEEISDMIKAMCGKRPDTSFSVLVAGLGNLDITPDAIGPLTAKEITVTRHIGTLDGELFGKMGYCNVSAVIPGVLAQTGIETVEMVKSAAQNVTPDLIIAIDALAARSCERLASTIQLSDNGISPGSGIGNMRKAINRENIGVPVLALGVPTVVDSSTLVYDALRKAGIEEVDGELSTVLENGRGFFVSPKESDVITKSVAHLLAQSLDNVFRI